MKKEINVEAKLVDIMPLLNHISEYSSLTDEEISKRSTGVMGLDAVECLELTLERELCKSSLKYIIDTLTNKQS